MTKSFYRYEAYFIQPSENVSSKFTKPFHSDLVACFLVTILVVSVIFALFHDEELPRLCGERYKTVSSVSRRIYDGVFLACALICQKGSPY